MNRKEVNFFEKIYSQMESLHAEVSILSKKSPNDGINKFKLKFINKVLEEANSLLKEKYKPFTSFDFFEEDDVPTNSDVTMILAQYLNCMEKLRCDNIIVDFSKWYWIVDDEKSDIRTLPPKKLKG